MANVIPDKDGTVPESPGDIHARLMGWAMKAAGPEPQPPFIPDVPGERQEQQDASGLVRVTGGSNLEPYPNAEHIVAAFVQQHKDWNLRVIAVYQEFVTSGAGKS